MCAITSMHAQVQTSFREMPRKALEEYSSWFHHSLPERIGALKERIRATSGFEDWQPDLTRESIDSLGQWFETRVQTRNRTPEELKQIKSKLTFSVDVPSTDLTDETFSLAADVGKYLSQAIISAVPATEWKQDLSNKRSADFGQPVLIGRGPVPLNPVRVALNCAYGISRGKPSRLSELYDYWVKALRGEDRR